MKQCQKHMQTLEGIGQRLNTVVHYFAVVLNNRHLNTDFGLLFLQTVSKKIGRAHV